RWSACECVTRTTPTVRPAICLFRAARCASSSGPGSMTATTGPASRIQVFVPGPVYGPGFGATTRATRTANRSARVVRGQVDVDRVGRARVEPALELGVDDQPHQRLAQLGHGEGRALARD